MGTAATAHALNCLLARMEDTMIPKALAADQKVENFFFNFSGPKSITETVSKSMLHRLVFLQYPTFNFKMSVQTQPSTLYQNLGSFVPPNKKFNSN